MPLGLFQKILRGTPLSLPNLPIRAALPALLTALETGARAVLEAPPGAGKTTLVPLALLGALWRADGKILVLEPRRLAARAAATRMAALLGEPVGQTVGYRVRLENCVSNATRVEVVTEGILTRLLQDDPTLDGVAAILFDEFHERSLQADLGLALALDAQTVLRPDLRIVVMSATLETDRLAAWLGAGPDADGVERPGPAPVVRSEGKMFPVETHYAAPAAVAAAGNRPSERLSALAPAAIHRALREHATGDVLVFLPGLADQRRVADRLSLGPETDLHVLHGELPLDQQDAALRPAPAGRRKVVLATSIAETSLTIEGVRIVVDGGFARVPRYEPRTGLTTLATEPVSRAAANQRRGRAGRLGPGICYRLWPEADHAHLSAHAAPEIRGADLSALALETALWGTPAENLRWLDPPPAPALAQSRELLMRLGAVSSFAFRVSSDFSNSKLKTENSKLPTPHGRALARLGLTPRLGHLVLRGHAAGFGTTAAALAALLAERDLLTGSGPGGGGAGPTGGRFEQFNPDLRLRLEALVTGRAPLPGLVPDRGAVARVREAATALRRRAGITSEAFIQPDAAGLLTALAYPDRLAQRETPERVRLLTGQRVLLPDHFFSASDQFFAVATLESGGTGLARASLAAPVSLAEIEAELGEQIETTDEVRFDDTTGRVSARRRRRLGALVLADANLPNPAPDAIRAALVAALQAAGAERLPWPETAAHLRERLAFLHHLRPTDWPAVDFDTLSRTLAVWLEPHLPPTARSLADVARLDFSEALLRLLPGAWAQRQELDRLAPSHLTVPSGSSIRLDYADPGTPILAVRLQEVFGLLDTPTVGGPARVPLLLHLLSPARRPVQVTRDLRSFWEKGYFEVRKDLRGRYPKHHWPENPLEATPTARAKPRGT